MYFFSDIEHTVLYHLSYEEVKTFISNDFLVSQSAKQVNIIIIIIFNMVIIIPKLKIFFFFSIIYFINDFIIYKYFTISILINHYTFRFLRLSVIG